MDIDINTLFFIVLIIIILFFFSTMTITFSSGDIIIPGTSTMNTLTTSAPASVASSTSSKLLDSATQLSLAGIQNKFYYDNMRYIPNP